jgi:hypothetical protein
LGLGGVKTIYNIAQQIRKKAYSADDDPCFTDEEDQTDEQKQEIWQATLLVEETEKQLQFDTFCKILSSFYSGEMSPLPTWVYAGRFATLSSLDTDTYQCRQALATLSRRGLAPYKFQVGSPIRNQRGYLAGAMETSLTKWFQDKVASVLSSKYNITVLLGDQTRTRPITLWSLLNEEQLNTTQKEGNLHKNKIYDSTSLQPLTEIALPLFPFLQTKGLIAVQFIEEKWYNPETTNSVALKIASAWQSALKS